jgi:hypothetical protein
MHSMSPNVMSTVGDATDLLATRVVVRKSGTVAVPPANCTVVRSGT